MSHKALQIDFYLPLQTNHYRITMDKFLFLVWSVPKYSFYTIPVLGLVIVWILNIAMFHNEIHIGVIHVPFEDPNFSRCNMFLVYPEKDPTALENSKEKESFCFLIGKKRDRSEKDTTSFLCIQKPNRLVENRKATK